MLQQLTCIIDQQYCSQAKPNSIFNSAPNMTVVLANKQDTLSAEELYYYSYNSCLDVSKLFTACSPMAK